jgi:hypothetical protein
MVNKKPNTWSEYVRWAVKRRTKQLQDEKEKKALNNN